ncbi:UNVERIFIED_CONTAM: hypothetical protein FKN15_061129 [Acipenser sinensis]
MKCLREKGQGPRIDQYFLRSQSSQSNEIQRQEANHSSQDISTPVIDMRRTCMDTVSDEPNDPCEPAATLPQPHINQSPASHPFQSAWKVQASALADVTHSSKSFIRKGKSRWTGWRSPFYAAPPEFSRLVSWGSLPAGPRQRVAMAAPVEHSLDPFGLGQGLLQGNRGTQAYLLLCSRYRSQGGHKGIITLALVGGDVSQNLQCFVFQSHTELTSHFFWAPVIHPGSELELCLSFSVLDQSFRTLSTS